MNYDVVPRKFFYPNNYIDNSRDNINYKKEGEF